MNHHRVPWEGYPLTAGRNAGQFVHGEDPMDDFVDDALVHAVMGLRAVTMAGPNHLRLEMGPGTDPDGLSTLESFALSSVDDPEYRRVSLPSPWDSEAIRSLRAWVWLPLSSETESP